MGLPRHCTAPLPQAKRPLVSTGPLVPASLVEVGGLTPHLRQRMRHPLSRRRSLSVCLLLLLGRALSLMSTNRAILFDIDGTLCDSSALCFESTNRVLQNNGFPPINLAEYKEGSKYTTPRRFAWHVTQNPDDEIGIRLGREFDRMYVELVSSDTVPLFNGIPELIREIRTHDPAVKLGALSNACSEYARAIRLSHDVLSTHLDVCFGVEDVPAAKPSGEGLLATCRALGVDPALAVYVGDAPSDGQAAAAAGMKSVGVSWGSFQRAAMLPHFNYIVDSIEEMQDLAIQRLLSKVE